MKKLGLIISILFCLGGITTAQTNIYPIEKIDSLMQKKEKPILILMSTDWCTYCQMQKNQVIKNKEFQRQSTNFYYVILNAESKEDIHFHHQTYHYKPTGNSSGINELAVALNGSENIAFPSWILLNRKYEVIFRYGGVLSPAEIKKLLNAIDPSN